MATRLPPVDPYNLRLSRRPRTCISGVHIAPGLVGHCHETPLCDELLVEQAPALAGALAFLHAVRAGDLDRIALVDDFTAFADRHLGSARLVPAPTLDGLWRLEAPTAAPGPGGAS